MSCITRLTPKISWITTTPGPVPCAGTARYAANAPLSGAGIVTIGMASLLCTLTLCLHGTKSQYDTVLTVVGPASLGHRASSILVTARSRPVYRRDAGRAPHHREPQPWLQYVWLPQG